MTVPFTALLVYEAADPYAVRMEFPAPGGKAPTTWIFARSLLDEGIRVASGEGDVEFLPCGPDYTGMELHNTAGRAMILLKTRGLRRFMAETYQMVPAGHEHHLFDLDVQLTRILGEPH
ncbi:SsgA family sporulation/cell division regulator [Streptomyces zhihengii]|uniref:SsgA family sporulation/cell division regulator n=1 Tax=Streptomyces zhihengii TaxID=1818004 RepID=UPI0033BFB0FD